MAKIVKQKNNIIKRILILCLSVLLLAACSAENKTASDPVVMQTAAPTAVSIVVTTDVEDPAGPDEYAGWYANGNYDTVMIEKSGEEYRMSVSLYRLALLEEGTVFVSAEGIVFKAFDPAGDPMKISFYRDGEQYALRIDESTWPLLEQGRVIVGFKATTAEEIEAGYSSADHAQNSSAEYDEWGDLIDPNDLHDAPQSHYVFQPKIYSVYMEEVFGKDMCDAWCNLVDAVMAGEDTFACKDQHTYNWMMGQFFDHCLPVLRGLIDYAWDRENSVIDGIASFTYLVPPEEAKAKIEEFGKQVEDILNKVLEDDYSDFEKALALYDYFSRTYQYDYETYLKMYDVYVDYTSCYRFFQTGIGICHEISSAYSYLLLQAGVQADTMSGTRSYDKAGHQWSVVRINGKNYHIDPTYVLGTGGALCYFLMTDEQREQMDDYDPSTFYAVSHYSQDNPHPDYTADDDTFRPLWDTTLETFFHETHTVLCSKGENDYGEWIYEQFDYAGY